MDNDTRNIIYVIIQEFKDRKDLIGSVVRIIKKMSMDPEEKVLSEKNFILHLEAFSNGQWMQIKFRSAKEVNEFYNQYSDDIRRILKLSWVEDISENHDWKGFHINRAFIEIARAILILIPRRDA